MYYLRYQVSISSSQLQYSGTPGRFKHFENLVANLDRRYRRAQSINSLQSLIRCHFDVIITIIRLGHWVFLVGYWILFHSFGTPQQSIIIW